MTEDLSKYKQPFDPDWPHGHLAEDRPARVICSDLKGKYPYAVAYELASGKGEILLQADSNGHTFTDRCITNAPAPKRTWWVNLCPHSKASSLEFSALHHETKEDADMMATPGRIACIKVTEGEGLEDV